MSIDVVLRTCVMEHIRWDAFSKIDLSISLIDKAVSKGKSSNILTRFSTLNVFDFISNYNQSLGFQIEFNLISKRVKLPNFKIIILLGCWLLCVKFDFEVFLKSEIAKLVELFRS